MNLVCENNNPAPVNDGVANLVAASHPGRAPASRPAWRGNALSNQRSIHTDRGLDGSGFIRPEVSLDRISPRYAPVVDDLRGRCRAVFGSALRGLYLNGSVPKGTAVPGVSDLDALAILGTEPLDAHEVAAAAIADEIQARHPMLGGVGIGLFHRDVIVSPSQRYDMGFYIKCLCACVEGEDLGLLLPRFRPSMALARGSNGNIRRLLEDRRARVAASADPAEIADICKGIMRKIVRTGFTLVMPRWRGWTSDLEPCTEIFAMFYPGRADAMRTARSLARDPSGDRAVVLGILDGLGSWLADEYDREILGRG